MNVVRNRCHSKSDPPSRHSKSAMASRPPTTANMIVTGLPANRCVRNLFYDRADTTETVNFRGSFLVLANRSKERLEPLANA